ncbi:MAG: TlpA disulfide reductase family protein, partial [Planctomycetota bacterium]
MHPVVSLLLALSLAPLAAQDLTAGMPAPPLHINKWLKGEPVAAFAKDRVYVVEFWATWCGPCIDGMPHLSEVQKKNKDRLTVIGVTSEDEHNTLAAAEAMVKSKGESMGYTVAWDDGGKTNAAWFEASGQDGIPCAFVVDGKGVLVWIGHPQWLDVVLPDVLAGKGDAEQLAAKLKVIEQRMMRIYLAAQVKPETAVKEL